MPIVPSANGTNDALRVVAEFSNYDQLRSALRARWQDRGYAIEHACEVIGVSARFLNKALALNPSKKINVEILGDVLQGFGLKCLLIEDPEAIERFENRIRRADPKWLRSVAVHFQITSRHVRRAGRIGGENSRKYMSPEEASELGKRGAIARWKRARARPRRRPHAGNGAARPPVS